MSKGFPPLVPSGLSQSTTSRKILPNRIIDAEVLRLLCFETSVTLLRMQRAMALCRGQI